MSTHSMLMKAGMALVFGILGAPVAGAVCTGPQALQAKVHTRPGAESYIDQGTWFGQHNQYSCALDSFKAALRYEPGSARLLYLMGLTEYSAGHLEDAVGLLQRSIQAGPQALKPRLILATTLTQLKRHAEAEAQWEAALKIDPTTAVALDGLSNAWIDDGDYASAIALLRSVPPDEVLALDLARAYAKSGLLDDARAVLTEALDQLPSSVRLADALVTVYVKQTRYSEASKLAEKCVQLNPGNIDAQRTYLRVLILNGESAAARPLASKLLAGSPHDFDFLYLSGVLEREAGEYPAARAHLEEAIAINPNHFNSRYNLGSVLVKLQDYKGAKGQLDKAIALGATEPEVHFQLATALRSMGEADQAKEQLQLYQQGLKVKADRTQAAIKSAEAATEPDPQKAATLYREASEALPDDAMLAYKLALALDRTGDIAGETAALEHAVKIDPGMAVAQNQLGYVASRNGDTATAEQHFRLALKAAPGYSQAWVSLAATLGMESRLPEAQEAVAQALKLDPTNSEALQLSKDLNAAQAQH